MSKAKWVILFLLAVVVAVPSYAVELTLGGFPSFFRIRPQIYKNATFIGALSDAKAKALGFDNADDLIVFVDTRLRLTPQLVLSDAVTIRAQVDVADNMIWGGLTSGFANDRRTIINSSLTPSDRFRGALLTDIGLGTIVSTFGAATATDDVQFFNVRMLHADIVLPNNLGFMRIGRQPFDWGIGILANGGWDPLSDLGFVLDRFLYLKSWPIYKGTFTFVFVSDRITQGVVLQSGSGDGYDIGAVAVVYNQGPLTIGGYIFPYIHQNNVLSVAPSGGPGGPTTPGVITGIDLDRFTLYSGLIDFKTDVFRLVGELQGGWGEVDGLKAAFGGSGKSDIDNTNILFAVRAEVYPGFPVKLIGAEFGYSHGDDVDTPLDFEGNVIHFSPAYNLDNLLFKHIIPNVYRLEGSVINAYYARAWATAKIMDKVSFTPQVVVAWNQETDAPLFAGQEVDRFLGVEVEGTLSVEVVPGVNLDFIGGLVISGDGLKDLIEQQASATVNSILDADGNPVFNTTPGEFDAPDLPFTFQGRLLVYIDQFFKK